VNGREVFATARYDAADPDPKVPLAKAKYARIILPMKFPIYEKNQFLSNALSVVLFSIKDAVIRAVFPVNSSPPPINVIINPSMKDKDDIHHYS